MNIECIEINWLCKCRNQIRSSQSSMLINSCTKLSKTQFSLSLTNIRFDEDVFRCLDQDVYIHLSHTSKTNIFILVIGVQDVFKTSSRRLQNVFNRYHQVKLFFLACLRGVFNTFLRRTAKMNCLDHTSDKILQNLQEWQKFIEF